MEKVLQIILQTIRKGEGAQDAITDTEALAKATEELDGTLNDSSEAMDALRAGNAELAAAIFESESAARKLAAAEKELAENTDPSQQRELTGEVIKASAAYERATDKVEELGEESKKAGKKGKDALSEWAKEQGIKQKFQILGQVIQGVGKAFDLAAKEAEKLGRTDVSDNINAMHAAFAGLTDTLVQVPIGGRDFLQWMGDAAEGATNAMHVIQALAIKFEQMTGVLTDEQAALQAAALMTTQLTAAEEAAIDAQIAAAAASEDAKEQWDASAIAKARAAEAATALTKAENDLSVILAGPVSAELDAYYAKQKDAGAAIADTQGKIDELNKRQYLTPAQKEEIEGLNKILDEQKGVYADNAAAHKEATAQIVLDMITQRYAADGLQAGEIAALGAIGKELGLYDEKTASVMKSVDDAITEHGTNAAGVIDALRQSLTDLPEHKDFTYTIHVNGDPLPVAGEAGIDNWTPPAGTTGGSGNSAGGSGGGGGTAGSGSTVGMNLMTGSGGGGDTIVLQLNGLDEQTVMDIVKKQLAQLGESASNRRRT